MKRPLAVLALLVVVASCDQQTDVDEPTPTPFEITARDVRASALDLDDVGDEWQIDADATPSTVQVGGTVGPANVKDAEADKTIAFEHEPDAGTGYLSNSVFLLASADVARALMAQHREANDKRKWTQDFEDGAKADFERIGNVRDLPALGDETYSVKIEVRIGYTDRSGALGQEAVEQDIEYVVYRIDRVVAFIVAKDTGVRTSARKQERKLTRLAA